MLLLYPFLKGYISARSNVSGYGNIECNGNETKLEECTVRKNIHQTCSSTAVAIHCLSGKTCMSDDKIHMMSVDLKTAVNMLQ